jgi:hypothetical protein
MPGLVFVRLLYTPINENVDQYEINYLVYNH